MTTAFQIFKKHFKKKALKQALNKGLKTSLINAFFIEY